MNAESRDEKSWHKVGKMSQERTSHSCLWYGSNIIITGGYLFKSRADVEILNTNDYSIRKSTEMLKGRHGHKMMLYNGYPTVVGGKSFDNYLSNIESFNISNSEWFTKNVSLKEARVWHGLVETKPQLGVRGDLQCSNE